MRSFAERENPTLRARQAFPYRPDLVDWLWLCFRTVCRLPDAVSRSAERYKRREGWGVAIRFTRGVQSKQCAQSSGCLEVCVLPDSFRDVSVSMAAAVFRDLIFMLQTQPLSSQPPDTDLLRALPLLYGQRLSRALLRSRNDASISGILYPSWFSLQRFMVVIKKTSSDCDFVNNRTALTRFTLHS